MWDTMQAHFNANERNKKCADRNAIQLGQISAESQNRFFFDNLKGSMRFLIIKAQRVTNIVIDRS